MKILLFGGSGQLGADLISRASDLNFEVVAPVISEIDICDSEQVRFLAERVGPDVVINSAAYTNVDGAETDRENAFRVNSDGARSVAMACKAVGSRMIHVSTDYVFDGSSTRPYSEESQTNPLNVYGASKLGGEHAVMEILGERVLIARTAWLHGARGANFIQTMIKLFSERELIKVVDDQIGSPTWSGWLAETILDLGRANASGIFHTVCSGSTSWFGLACYILGLVRDRIPGGTRVRIEPQTTAEANRKANRPANSVLDCAKLTEVLGRPPIPWQDGVRGHLLELGLLEANE